MPYERVAVSLVELCPRTIEREMRQREQEELLLAMSMVAHSEAHKHLSGAGREVLQMMNYTSRHSGLSIGEAYVEASATASLSDRDKDIIKAYLARRTLIEAFSEETVDGE